jgi:hypothetical protein
MYRENGFANYLESFSNNGGHVVYINAGKQACAPESVIEQPREPTATLSLCTHTLEYTLSLTDVATCKTLPKASCLSKNFCLWKELWQHCYEGENWTIMRYLPKGFSQWYSTKDSLKGISPDAGSNLETSEWTRQFNTKAFTKYLITYNDAEFATPMFAIFDKNVIDSYLKGTTPQHEVYTLKSVYVDFPTPATLGDSSNSGNGSLEIFLKQGTTTT